MGSCSVAALQDAPSPQTFLSAGQLWSKDGARGVTFPHIEQAPGGSGRLQKGDGDGKPGSWMGQDLQDLVQPCRQQQQLRQLLRQGFEWVWKLKQLWQRKFRLQQLE